MRIRVALATIVTFSLLSFSLNTIRSVHAQSTPATVAPENFTSVSHVDGAQLASELKSRRFDALIEETTQALPSAVTPEDKWLLRYFRGCAYWSLGFLEEAEADMTAAGGDDYVPVITYTTPRWFIQTIEKQKVQRPAVRRDVSVGGVPMFTIFSDDDDEALRRIVDLLPVAVNSVKRLTGVDPHKTVILVFRSIARMKAFDDVPVIGDAMGCWAWAHASASGVRVCPAGALATPAPDLAGFYFRATITHEYMHTAVARILEGETPMPIWLNEGVADVAGSLSAPAAETRHAYRFAQVLQHHAILPLATMSGIGYYQETQNQYAHGGQHDPYAQGHAMTTFLLLGHDPGIVITLLQKIKATHDFSLAFSQTFGITVENFYRDWRLYTGQ